MCYVNLALFYKKLILKDINLPNFFNNNVRTKYIGKYTQKKLIHKSKSALF